MTHHYPDLGSASDWLKQISLVVQPMIRSTARSGYWHVISMDFLHLFLRRLSFHAETSDSVTKCSEINAESHICFTTELKINHQSFCTTAESSCYCWLLTTLQWNLSVSGTFQHICSNSECKRCLSAEFSSCMISQHQSPGIEKQKDVAMCVSLKFSREWN